MVQHEGRQHGLSAGVANEEVDSAWLAVRHGGVGWVMAWVR